MNELLLISAIERTEKLFHDRYPLTQGRISMSIGAFLDFREGALFVTCVDSAGDKSVHWTKDQNAYIAVAQALPRLGALLKTRLTLPEQTQEALATLEAFLSTEEMRYDP